MNTETPSSLPAIDAVDIVDLRKVDANRAGEHIANAKAAPAWRVVGPEAQKIAVLWRSLPAGEQMRCHVPPFGFRFFTAGVLVAEASVCWECNNLFGTLGGREFFFKFDSSSHPARDLLAVAEQTTGIMVAG